MEQIKALAVSIFITLLVSFGISGFVTFGLLAFEINAAYKIGFALFGLTAILQIIIGYFQATSRETSAASLEQMAAEYATAYAELMDKQTTPVLVTCSYCNIQQHVPISLVNPNRFVCNNCNQTNKVYIQLQTTRITSPLAGVPVPKEEIPLDDNSVIERPGTETISLKDE